MANRATEEMLVRASDSYHERFGLVPEQGRVQWAVTFALAELRRLGASGVDVELEDIVKRYHTTEENGESLLREAYALGRKHIALPAGEEK